jgi:hypothetical protein
MSTKARVEAYCKKHNIELDDSTSRDNIDISVYTPKGIRFKSTGYHSAVTAYPRAQRGEESNEWVGTKADGWRHVWEDLSYGLEECDEPNCGYCERGMQNV